MGKSGKMVTFKEQKISLQKLEKVITEDGEREGYACKLSIRIDGMLPRILNNSQINGQIEQYEVSFTVNDNNIYGVKTGPVKVENHTQIGWQDVESVESGEYHNVRIEIDDGERFTMKVDNYGGAKTLRITFTIISEHPIEHNNVINAPSNDQVAVQDYSQRNETPTGKIRIIEDSDEEGDDTAKTDVEKSWRMKKDVENHIEQMTGGSIDHGNLHGYNPNASGLSGKNPEKKGAKPKTIVENTADLIDFIIKKGELSKDNVYVLVDYDDKNYIVTLSESETIQDLINRFMQISGATIDATKIDVRNQASEKNRGYLEPEFVCKEIPVGRQKTHHFAPKQQNIKWVVIKQQS